MPHSPRNYAPTHAISVADPWAWALTYHLTHTWRTSTAPPEGLLGNYLAVRVQEKPASLRARRALQRIMGFREVPDHISYRPGQVHSIAKLVGWGLLKLPPGKVVLQIAAAEPAWDIQASAQASSPWLRGAPGAGKFVWFFDAPRWVPSGFTVPDADARTGAWPLPEAMLAELVRVGQHGKDERLREAAARARKLPAAEHFTFRWRDDDPPGMELCVKCSLIRPRVGGFSKPCRGPARISLRTEEPYDTSAPPDA